jgi:Ni/Co efflux regulator RcnB
MEKFDSKFNARRAALKRSCAHALAAVLLALLASAFVAAQVRPPARSQQQQRQQAGARKDSPFDRDEDADDEDESESVTREATRARVTDPATILRRARFVYVNSDSAFVNAHEVEDSLLKRKEFKAWGMVVTRNFGEADLVVEITRKAFTRRFTFTVIDPRTNEVLASGKMRSVLLGKKISNKVAEQFANRVKVYRPYP